jgi:aspartyl protease family protein
MAADFTRPDICMRSVVTFAAFAIVASITVPRYAAQFSGTHVASTMMAARAGSAAQPATTNSRSVVVSPDRRGHFQVEGHIDGRRLEFMVDTGASVIALTASDAAAIGIHPTRREYTALINTANGTVRAAPVRLNMVEVGDLMLHDVAAMVMPEGALTDNLLGISFLSRLRRYEYSDGKLVLEQ